VLFVAYNEDVGSEHWRSDGSRLGTVPFEAAVGPVSSAFYLTPPFIATDTHLFFLADDAVTGLELWAISREAFTAKCPGDCDKNRRVSVDELVVGVGMALERTSPSECAAFDSNENGGVEIAEVVKGVRSALSGCEGT
jgi:ELWxxDGT repeat protein